VSSPRRTGSLSALTLSLSKGRERGQESGLIILRQAQDEAVV
jgi:hypothetical protein